MPDNTNLALFVKKYINPAIIDATFAGVYNSNLGYKVYAKPSVPTACTYFDEKEKKHYIFIGNDFSKYLNAETHLSKSSLVKALLIHELGHTRHTFVSSDSLNRKLKEAGIPFSLFNLAEDARIEKLIKEDIAKESGLNYKFGWEEWFVSPEITANSSPEKILFLLINSEGRDSGRAIVSPRVYEYYQLFLNAKSSYEVVDILSDWKNEFKIAPNQAQNDELRQRMSELMQEIMDLASEQTGDNSSDNVNIEESRNPQLRNFTDIDDLKDNDGNTVSLEDFMEDAMSQEEAGSPKIQRDSKFNTVTIKEASSVQDIFTEDEIKKESYNSNEEKKIIKELGKINSTTKDRVASRKPSNRFNTSRLFGVLSDPAGTKIYKQDKNINMKKVKKNILFVLDLSGSMSGNPLYEAKTLLLGANELAKKFKNLNISLLGSKVYGGDFKYQTISLPASKNSILSPSADGSSEGIGHALAEAKNIVSKNDVVIFITDGNIHDREINKAYIGKYLKPNAISLGVYVSDNNHYNHEMNDWFDELIIRENMIDATIRIVECINMERNLLLKKNHIENNDERAMRPSM